MSKTAKIKSIISLINEILNHGLPTRESDHVFLKTLLFARHMINTIVLCMFMHVSKLWKTTISFVMSVCPYGITRLPLVGP
jgi:hypothetical protein